MKILKTMLCVCGFSLAAVSCSQENQTKEEQFKYTVDEFADLQILRYRIPGWDSLTLQQKGYIYHLGEAAKSGRDILFSQNFKYNIRIRKILEKILEEYNGDKTTQQWNDFVVYAKRAFFSNGIHHHYAEDKIIPACPQEYMTELMNAVGQGHQAKDMIPVMYDPQLYPQRKYTGNELDVVEASAVNFYGSGITKDEVNAYYGKMEKDGGERPLAYGINSRLIKDNGKLVEQVYKIGGRYSNSINVIVSHLEKALELAENDRQKDYIGKLIEYYRTGSLEMWDEYNISWVQDNESKSRFGGLRGLHFQAAPYTQAKLVRVIRGAVLDVAVDLRKGSPTYGKHHAEMLTGDNRRQILVPRGFAHGFIVLEDDTVFAYKCDNLYSKASERGMRFDDPELGIKWPELGISPILSEKDVNHPFFKDVAAEEV